MKLQTILFGFSLAFVVSGADINSAVQKLGGTFNAATGAAEIKGNRNPDVAALAELCGNPALKSLHLGGAALKSDGVAAIASSKALIAVNLEHSMVNQVKDLETLAKLSTLEELDLGGSNFGDDGLAAICALKNLKALKLGHVGRDDKHSFTANGLKALTGLPKLEILMLHLHQPTPEMIPVLAGLKMVKDFKVGGIDSAYLALLKRAMPNATVTLRGQPAK